MALYSAPWLRRNPLVLRNPMLASLRLQGVKYFIRANKIAGGVNALQFKNGLSVTTPSEGNPLESIRLEASEWSDKNTKISARKFNPLDMKVSIMMADPNYYSTSLNQPYITFDYVPNQVNINVNTEQNSIGVVGINNAVFHFGGSADSINFEVRWFDTLNNSDRVHTKCRKVAALAKADGWKKGPPEILIHWGKNNSLFKDQVFIVESASYVMDTFLLRRIQGSYSYKDNDLLPLMAVQTIMLKKVGPHDTHESYIGQ